jgi:indolepyruvate ferredoxin oxidoreductase alpha subunit
MAKNRITELVEAEEGRLVVLQGNIAFAVGCARGGLHGADGYPGTPSTEVIDKGLRFVQDRMRVGWSVNEAQATAVGFGYTMAGADAVVTMKIPGLFQAADVVATAAGYTAPRGGLVLYVASDFVPSSTQYVTDPRYFLKSCFVPVLEPRNHQEMATFGPLAAELSREHATPVVVLANGLLCHSEGLLRLPARREVPLLDLGNDFTRFMNLPEIARRNYDAILGKRMPSLQRFAEQSSLNSIAWHDLGFGVVVHGMTALYLREVWAELPFEPSVLSLGTTFPLPVDLLRRFAARITGPIVVLGDGLRFVQEEMLAHGIRAEGKEWLDPTTEWTPETVAVRLGAAPRASRQSAAGAAAGSLASVRRPAAICPGCPYRGFGLVVEKLRKQRKIVASFGDIGCNTLLYFLKGIDSCTCMGASESERQGAVLARPSLAGKAISVIGDSTECHSGLAATRNAVFRNSPGVKVVLDNFTTAMTGGQPAPSSPRNLAGEATRFDLVAALRGEGAVVQVIDAFNLKAVEQGLRDALAGAEKGDFTVLVVRGACIREVPPEESQPRYEIAYDRCKKCDLCLVCPGLERDEQGAPQFTHLCNGCGGNDGICLQRCHLDAIVLRRAGGQTAEPPTLPPLPPDDGAPVAVPELPPAIRVAVRGVGGQGNLFLGKVLAELAMLAGFDNVVKGETHGMAQLGGAVTSTFGCGTAHSPVLAPGTVDVLVALEQGEVLRPGFLDLLRPEGVVLLNRLRIVPAGLDPASYPASERILAALAGRRVIEFDALAEAKAMGDAQGRTSNVVALGLISTVGPFGLVPEILWRRALMRVSPGDYSQRANLAAFERGRRVALAAAAPQP